MSRRGVLYDPELWDHLVRISKIVQRSEKLSNVDEDCKEVTKLREENNKLREENKLLTLQLSKIERQLYEALHKKNESSSGTSLTQDTILTQVHDDDDADLTDVSPIKSQATQQLNFANAGKRKLIFDDSEQNNDNTVKRIKIEPQSDDDILEISQIEDSQGSSQVNNPTASIFHTILASNSNITDNKINLTQNPILNRTWYPEDFVKNPLYQKYINDRSKNYNMLPGPISSYFQRQQKHIQSEAMKDFNKVANGTQDSSEDISFGKENKGTLITPPQNCKENFDNPAISPIYKYEINHSNLKRYLKYFPNLLRTNKVKDWEIEDSEDNDKCADFLLTQDVQEKNKRSKERSKLKGLRMLFQACFVVENGKQVGAYLFRRKQFNEKVCNSEYVIDTSIFE